MKKLKKKIKFSKYYTLFSENKSFFICLLDTNRNYSHLRTELLQKKFKIKFIQNSFLKKLPYFFNIKNYLTGQIFCILKNTLDIKDYRVLNNLLIPNGHIILFYLDNQFYTNKKLKYLTKFFKNRISKLPYLSYFYFLLKLGFIIKFEKINQNISNRVRIA